MDERLVFQVRRFASSFSSFFEEEDEDEDDDDDDGMRREGTEAFALRGSRMVRERVCQVMASSMLRKVAGREAM